MRVTVTDGPRMLVLLLLVASLGACGLPRSGPTKREIFAGSTVKGGDAHVVSVTRAVARATAVTPAFGFSAGFRNAGLVGSDTIAAGDTLGLTVFENVRDDPLLGNTGQRVSSLDQVQVDGQGYIFVPYAGRVKAAGQTPEGLRQAITRKLDTQTPDPQVTVQRLAGDGSTVTVSGAVSGQGVFPIERPTRSLSTMLAKAGGVSIPTGTAIVRVTRGGQTGKVWLEDLYRNPGLDIALRSGDIIVVEEDTRSFVALGATGAQSRIPFETQNLSALEAIAQVGGLNTGLADPTGVFVFRSESAEIANLVTGRNDLSGDQRMIYMLDLTEPTGIFEARDFMIRDGDTLYVTEAPFVQWRKTLGAVTGTVGAADTLSTVGPGR
ncbi:polysaccharide export protein [Cereibacter changlensis]|uniref:Polysaccharide export protein n=2 Tax=Cereibacter changlensis TaxID=402884 RepID=A0A4U0YS05_9RHOB|nr:polysaccharide export protein [Cereibacter changlensis]